MTEPTTPPTEPAEPPTEQNTANGEAAKWRKKLREAESERDALRGTIETLRKERETLRKERVEEIARRDYHLPKPDSIWKAGVTLDEMLGENGEVDSAKVGAAITSAIESLGLRAEPPRLPPSPNAGREASGSAESTWGTFLTGGAQR